MADISKNIRRFRKLRGMSQTDLAEKLNVTRQTISSWETDKSYPDLDMVIQLSTVLETDPNCLLYPAAGAKKKIQNVPPVSIAPVFITALFVYLGMAVCAGIWQMLFRLNGVWTSYLSPIYGRIIILSIVMIGCTLYIVEELRGIHTKMEEKEEKIEE